MLRFLVNLYVSIFVPKKKRVDVKAEMLSFVRRFAVKRRALACGKGLMLCVSDVKVNKNTKIGDYCHFNGLMIYGRGEVEFGNYIHAGDGLVIVSDNHNYDGGEMLPYDKTVISKKTEIGDYAWLGVRVTILPGTKIGEGAIIQAGSVVHGEIPPCAIAGGNPAKVFKYRDIEHFNKLKQENKAW